MNISFTKGQALCLKLVALPCAAIRLLHLLGVEPFQLLLILLLAPLYWQALRLIHRLTDKPRSPGDRTFWINQSVSVAIPEGWSVESHGQCITLRHAHTESRFIIRTRQLSPAQIRTRILHQLEEFYHD